MNKRVCERVTKKVERESNNPKIKSECPLCGCIGVFHSCRYSMFDWNKRELPTGLCFIVTIKIVNVLVGLMNMMKQIFKNNF